MVPYGLDQQQFGAMYRSLLERASNTAIAAFRALLPRELEPGVDTARVEVFFGEDAGAPAVWIYWRGKNNKVDHADPSIFPGRSMELTLGLEPLADIDERYFIAPDVFPGLQLAVPLMSRWLTECWWKAGGWSYPLPTTLAVHDFGAYGSTVLSEGRI